MDLQDKRKVTQKQAYDVIVVGGGIAGVAAAVSSSRRGAKTLLIEKQINLGGLATVGLINWYEPLCDGKGNQVIYGIAEELIRLSIKYGFENLPAQWGGEGKNKNHYDRFTTNYSPTVFALALSRFIEDNGVFARYDTLATYPIVEKGRVLGIVAESVSGKEFYPCKCVIDASGDASVAFAAGLPTVEGENHRVYVCHMYDQESMGEYKKTGDCNKLRKWLGIGGLFNADYVYAKGYEISNKYNSDSENEFIKWGHSVALEKIKQISKDSRDIMKLPTMPQYRKIRRIVGEEVFDGSKSRCDDSIGSCGDFRNCGPVYELPYKCLYNKQIDNLLTAGRVISAEGEGWEITRVIPVCALTGEAAGIVAAYIATNGVSADSIKFSNIK